MKKVTKSAHHRFVQSDEFAKIREDSEQAQIGKFIKLDIHPKQLHIKIFKGIGDKAMKILSERLHEHIQTGDTKIVIKRSVKKGTYTYTTWLSVKDLKQISKEELLKKLLALTKEGKQQVQIIVRQNIAQGFIQELWSKKHSLL